MQRRHIASEGAWEEIQQNRQKGEPYRLEFRDDPTVYEGIPIPPSSGGEPGIIEPLVAEPEVARGRETHAIDEVEWLERKPVSWPRCEHGSAGGSLSLWKSCRSPPPAPARRCRDA